MIGQQIGEERGQVLVRRVLPTEGAPKIEVSFEAQGQILGVSVADMGTYVSSIRPDGTLYGEGSGITRSSDGSEIATWTGSGVGQLTSDGGASYRGAIYFQSQTPKLSRLNGIAALFEYNVDGSGKTESTLTEWK
ncbi:MAG TPA: hypothetical protein VGO87_13735 [Acidimicrobiia bacterium]|jgi:hypothetical protein